MTRVTDLDAYLLAHLDGDTLPDDVRQQLETDPAVQARLDQLRREAAAHDEFFGALRSALGSETRIDRTEPGGLDVAPDIVPGYVIHSFIARGGQAAVYEAEQDATKRTVALKLLAPSLLSGDRQRARFTREVEIVSGIQHPNVVTVFDGGHLPGGRHWLAMEFIDGVDLRVAIERVVDQATSPRGRDRAIATLFRDIAGGVDAAHRRGVIHRDLKPGNILVDGANAPRILDFGLARPLTEDLDGEVTRAGVFLGTVAYAAPEQLTRDHDAVDVRTDVYALGIMLYESLAGVRPNADAKNLADAIAAATEDDVVPPHSRTGAVSTNRDLGTIALRALAHDPDRRYQSAGRLRDDLDRFLNGEAIEARRDSTWYRVRTFVRRHRFPVAAATLIAALVVGSTIALLFQRERLRTQNTQYRSLAQSLVSILGSPRLRDESDPDSISIEGWLDSIGAVLNDAVLDDPSLEADMLTQIGLTNLDRQRTSEARPMLERALLLVIDEYGESHVDVAAAHHNIGRVAYFEGRADDALHHYTRAFELRSDLLGPRHLDTARTMSHLGAVLLQQFDDVERAEQFQRDALAIRLEQLDATHPDVSNSRNSLAVTVATRGAYAEAAKLLEDDVESLANRIGDNRLPTGRVLHNLARFRLSLGDHASARTALDDAISIKRQYWGDDTHPDLLRSMRLDAEIALMEGRIADARTRASSVLAAFETRFPNGHRSVASALLTNARVARAEGDIDRADDLIRRALDMPIAPSDADAAIIEFAACAADRDDNDEVRRRLAPLETTPDTIVAARRQRERELLTALRAISTDPTAKAE